MRCYTLEDLLDISINWCMCTFLSHQIALAAKEVVFIFESVDRVSCVNKQNQWPTLFDLRGACD